MDQYQAVDGRKAGLQRIKAEGGMSKYCAGLEQTMNSWTPLTVTPILTAWAGQ